MEEKIIKKAEGRIDMPQKIEIGDPMYFETGEGLEFTYSKSFRGKQDWSCALEVKESIITCPPDDLFPKGMKFNEVSFTVLLAYNEDMLNLLKQGKIYKRQSIKSRTIGVDTAQYMLNVNDSDITIKTGGDGSIGYVDEYFTKSKLEAIVIEASISDYDGYDFNSSKKLLEELFDCKLQDIIIE